MNAGKLASQSGHAFLDAFLAASTLYPKTTELYRSTGHGIKICLACPSLDELLRTRDQLHESNIPHALITDLGYTQFEGRSTITALGFGPVRRQEVYEFTNQFSLLRKCTV
mgnify:CR=1 FL=1